MNKQRLVVQCRRGLDTAVRWLGSLAFFYLLLGLTVFFAFPYGGGAFHAMFAYTHGGRAIVAAWLFVYLLASNLAGNSLLQYFRVGAPWWALTILGTLPASMYWQGVVDWRNEASPAFRLFVGQLAVLLPAACLLSGLAVRWIVGAPGRAPE